MTPPLSGQLEQRPTHSKVCKNCSTQESLGWPIQRFWLSWHKTGHKVCTLITTPQYIPPGSLTWRNKNLKQEFILSQEVTPWWSHSVLLIGSPCVIESRSSLLCQPSTGAYAFSWTWSPFSGGWRPELDIFSSPASCVMPTRLATEQCQPSHCWWCSCAWYQSNPGNIDCGAQTQAVCIFWHPGRGLPA